jgi:hypothetical protein
MALQLKSQREMGVSVQLHAPVTLRPEKINFFPLYRGCGPLNLDRAQEDSTNMNTGERAWKAIDDRLQRPCYLSKVVHDRKIRAENKEQISENIPS